MFGCNDNPSAQQLESAWRKLLGHHQVTASEEANCASNDFTFLNILSTSSRKPKGAKKHIEVNENNNIVTDEEIADSEFIFPDDVVAASFENHIACYLASLIEKSIVEGRWFCPLKCPQCLSVFLEDESVDNEFVTLKMRTSKLHAPSKSTVQICKMTEKSLQKFNFESGQYTQILNDIFAHLNLGQLFCLSDFDIKNHKENGHKIKLVQLIIDMYIKKKQNYITKCNTIASHDVFLRSKLKKLIHFKGQ